MSDIDDQVFDEPVFETHIANVLADYRDGLVDLDEAVTAILDHPGRLEGLKVVRQLDQ